ncbi:hypothetical protein THAOC_26858, partial [Thalassiosira oceanica]
MVLLNSSSAAALLLLAAAADGYVSRGVAPSFLVGGPASSSSSRGVGGPRGTPYPPAPRAAWACRWDSWRSSCRGRRDPAEGQRRVPRVAPPACGADQRPRAVRGGARRRGGPGEDGRVPPPPPG